MKKEEILLGNGALAWGLLKAGCDFITSYPGTPSSEIVPEAVRFKKALGLDTYIEWSVNEKVAFDVAFAACLTGKRSACVMKQVGLNVAADSLMSAAYLGVVGGMVIISCDDPGPHSSQTEQDTRLFAHFARVPVFDPSSPAEAVEMACAAFDFSERFRIPVILRPAIRVCHARQNISLGELPKRERKSKFEKDPQRWASTPRFRYILHKELNEKHIAMEKAFSDLAPFNAHNLSDMKESGAQYPLGVIAGGVPYANTVDALGTLNLADRVPLLKLGAPYPFPRSLVNEFTTQCNRLLVIEETDSFIELLLGLAIGSLDAVRATCPRRRAFARNRHGHHCPGSGGNRHWTASPPPPDTTLATAVKEINLPLVRPSLCPGCGHRSAFFAIRKAFPKAIYTSDIGCYTLGINLGVVDTVLDMGAAITMAAGFYQAHLQDGVEKFIVATIGDSTFYHSGTTGLLSSVYNRARFLLVILDNETTAMTGMQPTPGIGLIAGGEKGAVIPLETAVAGCGVGFVKSEDPFNYEAFLALLREAGEYVTSPEGGMAVVIARRPCHVNYKHVRKSFTTKVHITDDCNGCRVCIKRFECPAIKFDEETERAYIDRIWCLDCGFCVNVCPQGAIVEGTSES